jgi:4-hydroxyacetophenone monooxygenase
MPHIICNTKFIAAEWQTDRQLYTITIQDTRSGVRTITHAHILIAAHGILHISKMPSIPGLNTFKGRLFHSSQWNTSIDLRSLVANWSQLLATAVQGTSIFFPLAMIAL